MFRQVVAHRWSERLGDDAKEAFRAALRGLRAIPELVELHASDDAGHFAGNFEYVAVLDFADFAAARRYVEQPLHQSFIEHHARTCLAERVVVQHDWGTGSVVGFHHVKIPVSDVRRSRDWYGQVFGFLQEIEFVEDGVIADVASDIPRQRSGWHCVVTRSGVAPWPASTLPLWPSPPWPTCKPWPTEPPLSALGTGRSPTATTAGPVTSPTPTASSSASTPTSDTPE